MLWITVISVFGLVAGAPFDQQPAPCEVCHLLIGELQDYLTTDQSQNSVKNYARDICTKLQSNEKDSCLQFTENYAGLIFSKLNKDLSPELFCQNLPGICPKLQEEEVTAARVQDDAGCEICELLVTYLDQFLQDNGTAATINDTLYKICDAAPASFKTTCYVLVPSIESMINAGFDPKQACTFANFCQNDTTSNSCEMCQLAALTNNNEKLDTTCAKLCNPADKSIEANDPRRLFTASVKPCEGKGAECNEVGCAACKVLIQGLDLVVGANFTVDTINSTMTDICNKMAGESTKDACLKTVPRIVELLKTGLPAEEACKIVGLCEAEETIRRYSGKTENLGSKVKHVVMLNSDLKRNKGNEKPECIVCKGVGAALDTILKNNITIASLNSTLQDICVNLPADSLKKACFGAIPNIMKISKTGINVTDLCLKAKLCTSKDAVLSRVKYRKVRSVTSPKSQFSLKCDICEFVIMELDKELDDNSTQQTINSTVYGICEKLQGAFQDICLQSAPQIVTTIEQGFNTIAVCAQIKLCNSTTTYKQVPEIQRKEKSNGDLKCDICKYVVTEVDKRIGQNATIEKINQTVYELCEKLTGSLAILCKAAAPEIVKQLANGGDPEKVCEDIKLCAQSENLDETEDNKTGGNLPCDICKYLITEAEKRLTLNSTIQKINETMYNICSDLFGNLKKLCYAATPQIVTALQGGEEPGKVCTKVNFCASMVIVKALEIQKQVTQPIKLSSNVQGVECDLCKIAIKEVDSILLRNATGKDINATVYEFCSRLTGTLKDLCLNFAPQIVQVIKTGFDPEKACEAIKLCVPSGIHLMVETSKTEKLMDLPCDLCEFVVKEVDKYLAENSTELVINSTVFSACNSLTGALQSLCYNFSRNVVRTIEGGAEPLTTCKILNLCISRDAILALQKPLIEYQVDLPCDVCEFAVQEVDKFLAENSSAQVINSTVYSACNILTGTLQALCYNFAPSVVQTIEGGADPLAACQVLTLCAFRGVENMYKRIIQNRFYTKLAVGESLVKYQVDLPCDVCEFAVKEVDKYLAENSSEQVINSTVYSACNILTGTLQALCYSLAANVVQTIEGGADPLTACQLLTLCAFKDSTLRFESKTQLISPAMSRANDVECALCEFAIKELDTLLANNESAVKINATVYQICSLLPDSLKLVCLSVAPQVVSTVEAGIDPDAACTFIGFCTNMTTDLIVSYESPIVTHESVLDCNTCQRGLNEIWYNVQLDYAKVESLLFNLCGRLPLEYQSTCVFLVEQDNGVGFKKFIQDYSPVALCEMAGCMDFRVEQGFQNLP